MLALACASLLATTRTKFTNKVNEAKNKADDLKKKATDSVQKFQDVAAEAEEEPYSNLNLDSFTEGYPVGSNLPGCNPILWSILLVCMKNPNDYFYKTECKSARRMCRRSPSPAVCPDVSKTPPWWFMEPGWFRHAPGWARGGRASLLQEQEGVGAAPPAEQPRTPAAAPSDGAASGPSARDDPLAAARVLMDEQEAGTAMVEAALARAEASFAELRARADAGGADADAAAHERAHSMLSTLTELQSIAQELMLHYEVPQTSRTRST